MIRNDNIPIKNSEDIKKMKDGGEKLARVKKELVEAVRVGVDASEVDSLAEKLIEKEGAKPSFKMVPGYSWSTCVNVNEGVVHGIPTTGVVFKKGDVVSVDVGIYYQGFHTDTSFSVGLDSSGDVNLFLEAGKKALTEAIGTASAGNRIFDISKAIENRIRKNGYTPIKALVGHGIGKDLHEDPPIPCFTSGKRVDSPEILVGNVFAIEVMYTKGEADLAISEDGWTIGTRDGKISALFEETVAITESGPLVLTL